MTEQFGNETQVLIVGAGPTGLTMASELSRHGVSCRIVDKAPAPSDKSKALGVQSRTLEVFEDMGVVNEAIAQGIKAHGVNAYAGGDRIIHLSLDELESPYPFVLILPQSETERILEKRLEHFGREVERQVKLVSFTQDAEGVTATLQHPDGEQEKFHTPWLIACDGAHSTVRHILNLPFQGVPYEEGFALADVRMHWSLPDDEIHIFLSEEGLLAIFPMGQGQYRLVANFPKESDAGRREDPRLSEFQSLVDERAKVAGAVLSDPLWLSNFRVQRRIVSNYRQGRIFLAGDAAHIHSPAGGQGMNTGIQDAYNLAWKLGLVTVGAANPSLLDSYDLERHPVGQNVLEETDLLTRVVSLHHPLAQQLRNYLAPVLLNFEVIQQRISRRLTELAVNYRHSPIVGEYRGSLAPVQFLGGQNTESPSISGWLEFSSGPAPGDRAPDAIVLQSATGATTQLFEILQGTQHTLLLLAGTKSILTGYSSLESIGSMVQTNYSRHVAVYLVIAGKTPPASLQWEGKLLLDLELSLHHRYGVGSECLYLVRPDGYVGFRSQPVDERQLREYLERIFTSVQRGGNN